MNPIRSKNIIVGLVIVFILFLLFAQGNDDYSYGQSGARTLGPIPTHSSYRSFDREQSYPTSSTWSHNQHISTRHEILQTKMKGYREATYWGAEHPNYEKVRDMNDDEFDCFIEKVELNDADVYWGSQY